MLTGVPKTALGVARIRAGESRRPEALFHDPYAAAFVAAMPDAYAEEAARPDQARSVGARLALHVIIRTRFYDEYLLAATASGIDQVVLLAAGLDARAFRLDWPAGTRLFEVDLPNVLEFKEKVLGDARAQPRCERVALAADLTGDWPAALISAGFDAARPTAWLIEGLLVYLPPADAARLLETVTGLSAAGSRLSCEQGRSASQLAAEAQKLGGSETTALWQGGLGEDVPTWLARHGWSSERYNLGALAASYGRPIETQTDSGFVTAIAHDPS